MPQPASGGDEIPDAVRAWTDPLARDAAAEVPPHPAGEIVLPWPADEPS